MQLFANIVECIQALTIFAKQSILGTSQGFPNVPLAKLNKNLMYFLYFQKKLELQSQRHY